MKLKGERKKESGIIRYYFKGDITIYTVKKLKKILMNELLQSSKVVLDLNDVVNFDSAGFQLLIYLDREAKRSEKQIQIIQKNICVSRIFNFFGSSI